MKSNEFIQLTNVDTGKVYKCLPNDEFIPQKGKFVLWSDAHIKNDENETVCHLRVLDFKDGAELPECLFPPKPKRKPKEATNDEL